MEIIQNCKFVSTNLSKWINVASSANHDFIRKPITIFREMNHTSIILHFDNTDSVRLEKQRINLLAVKHYVPYEIMRFSCCLKP